MMSTADVARDLAKLAELVPFIQSIYDTLLYARWNLFLNSSLKETSK